MTDVYKSVKKVFTVGVVMTTILWSVGASVLVTGVANAAEVCKTLKAGDVVQTTGNALFTVNGDGELLPWEQGWQGKTWLTASGAEAGKYVEAGYPTILSLSKECFAKLSLRAKMPIMLGVRPGTHPVYQKDADRYLYPSDNFKFTEIDKDAAEMFFGKQNWREVSTLFVQNYGGKPTGTKITKTSLPPMNMLVSDGTKYYIATDNVGGIKEVTDAGLTANGMNKGYAHKVTDLTGLTLSSAKVTAYDATYGNVTKAAEVVSAVPGTPTPTTTPVAGTVQVSLSSNTPTGPKVVVGVDNTVFTKVNLKNTGSTDINVNAVTLDRKGLGTVDDFTSITLYDGSLKLGSTKSSWNSDDTMTYNIANGWTIKAGATNELTVSANVLTAGTYNQLGVKALSLSDGTASGLPVWGNEMNGVSVTVGGVTADGVGSNATKNIGTNDVELAKFKLTVDSVEDAKVERIVLKNKAATSNAADDNISGVELYVGSTKIAGPVNMVSDKVTFDLSVTPYEIKKSKNETFTVRGDIVNGSGNTLEFLLDADSDLVVKGQTYGTNLSVTRALYDTASTDGSVITIGGAELNIAYSGSTADTTDDVTDVSLGTLTISPGATDVKITSMIFTVDETDGADTGGAVADIDNLELVDKSTGSTSGATYSGTMTGGGDDDATDETWTFTDEVYLTKGVARVFDVRGDIPATTTAGQGDGDSYKFNMTVNTTNLVAETVPAGDALSNFSIGSFTGKALTVAAPKLTITANSMNTGSATVNETDVSIWEGTLKATADDINVQRLRFEGGHATAGNVTLTVGNLATVNWTQLGLYTKKTGETSWTSQQIITNSNMTHGEADFSSLNFTVSKGETIAFAVKGTVASSVSSTAATVHVQLDTVSAKDTDNDDASIVDSGGTAIASGAELETTRSVTLYGTGILYVQMRNNDTGFNKDRILLAGNSAWVGKLRVRALYEQIQIKDLKLTNETASFEGAVKSVCLYKSMSTAADQKVGCTTLDTSDIAFFDDLNYTVQDTQDLYIYVETNPMSNAGTGTSRSKDIIEFKIVTTTGHLTAEGLSSGSTLSYEDGDLSVEAGEIVFDKDMDGTYAEAADEGGTASSSNFYVAGSKISNVQLVSSYGGKTVDTAIAGTGVYTLAILAITTEANNNTDASGNALKLGIGEFRFDLSKFVSTTFGGSATATIERIGGSDGAVALTVGDGSTSSTVVTAGYGTSDDWYLNTASTSMSNDFKIDAGTTAYYVVKGEINTLGSVSNAINWVQLGLDDVKGTAGAADANNNLDWLDGYDTTYALSSDFDYLLLDTTSITGSKISAPANN